MSEEESATFDGVGSGKLPTRKPIKVLPAAKLSSSKQLELLQAFAVASTSERKSVSNQEVADVSGVHSGTVSICNPFFSDIGLISKQGHKFNPAEEVLAYADRLEWDDNKAGHKLAPIIKKTWFAKGFLPRIMIRVISEEAAISILAELSGASPEYRNRLIMLLDYMEFSGLITRENGLIAPVKETSPKPDEPPEPEGRDNETTDPVVPQLDNSSETFQIPIPGHTPAQITVPKGLGDKDWEMLKIMIDAYISRLKEGGT